MNQSIPIATDARAALLEPEGRARTAAEAARTSQTGERALGFDWFRIDPDDPQAEDLERALLAGVEAGYVQVYEDADGRPLYAVSFWPSKDLKPTSDAKVRKRTSPSTKPSKTASKPKRRRKKPTDPRQMDLFPGPDQKGHESIDPDNRGIVLIDEEGTGATFGVEPKGLPPKDAV